MPEAAAPEKPNADKLPDVTLEPILVADRCDRCNARALVRAQFMNTEGALSTLDFCKHDFEAMEDAIRAKAIQILDQRELAATQ